GGVQVRRLPAVQQMNLPRIAGEVSGKLDQRPGIGREVDANQDRVDSLDLLGVPLYHHRAGSCGGNRLGDASEKEAIEAGAMGTHDDVVAVEFFGCGDDALEGR